MICREGFLSNLMKGVKNRETGAPGTQPGGLMHMSSFIRGIRSYVSYIRFNLFDLDDAKITNAYCELV